jgi:hypothetical protein
MKEKKRRIAPLFSFFAIAQTLCVDLPTIFLTIGVIFPLSANLMDGSDLCDRNARIVSGSEDSSTKGCLR